MALITSQDTAKAEKAVRKAANGKFGRRKKDIFYEHGQWWVRLESYGEDVFYSAVDSNLKSGPNPYGILFERV